MERVGVLQYSSPVSVLIAADGQSALTEAPYWTVTHSGVPKLGPGVKRGPRSLKKFSESKVLKRPHFTTSVKSSPKGGVDGATWGRSFAVGPIHLLLLRCPTPPV